MHEIRKTVVRVTLDWDEFGALIPRIIHWRDGRSFVVDRVLDVRRAPSTKAGGVGDRYTVRLTCEEAGIFGKTTYLFHEKGEPPEVWFVEEKVAKA